MLIALTIFRVTPMIKLLPLLLSTAIRVRAYVAGQPVLRAFGASSLLSAARQCCYVLPLLCVHATSAASFDVALTVDDLPAHGMLPPGMTRLGIAQSHIASLKAHGVVAPYGFVNAAKLSALPDGEAILDSWRSAGFPLGNHTFSHMNMGRAPSLEAWFADVEAGEPAVDSRMPRMEWRYLRLPHITLAPNRQEPALAYLKSRKYRIAEVSMSFSDWDYSDAYARCVAKGDQAAIGRMKAHYVERVEAVIAHTKRASQLVYGRMIPQVLLTHVGGWSAVTLPDVLDRLKRAGARFVSLDAAQTDPAYAAPGGGNIISRTAKEKGIELPPLAVSPLDTSSLCN